MGVPKRLQNLTANRGTSVPTSGSPRCTTSDLAPYSAFISPSFSAIMPRASSQEVSCHSPFTFFRGWVRASGGI